MSNEHLHLIREYELNRVLPEISRLGRAPADIHVLDIGAGTGHQSALLDSLGYHVTAVDLPISDYAAERVYPVVDYDGSTLPLDNASIDVVFSSNVLEHVADIDSLLQECLRVLADGGIAIHVLPTPAWRWWTTLCHYPWLAVRALALMTGRRRRRQPQPEVVSPNIDSMRSPLIRAWWTMLWPGRHGERGGALTEPFYYSERWWRKTFASAGFRIEASYPAGLFYTGCMLFAGRLSTSRREDLAKRLGSACRVYVLKPRDEHLR